MASGNHLGCYKFVGYPLDTDCRSCGGPKEEHSPCTHFFSRPSLQGVCGNCGLNDEEHTACRHFRPAYLLLGDVEDDRDDGQWCTSCGLSEEDHYADVCEKFRASPSDQTTCWMCGEGDSQHEVCEFYAHGSGQDAADDWCKNCGQLPIKHRLCPVFAALITASEWCLHCGLHNDDHPPCGRFVKGSDPTLCLTCGKHVSQHVWESYISSTLSEPHHQHGSAFPQHVNTRASFFVDGQATYAAMADAIRQAEKEILIADWILSPEVYLIRSDRATLAERLDRMLLERAKAGVIVYVLAWNETKLAFKFANGHAKNTLESLHPNIKVITHPGATGPLEWSHHDKIVCVDRSVAFLGGLDLAFGRYDTPSHSLTDECHLRCTWPGKDYYNPSFSNLQNVDRPFDDLLDRTTVPRMPWHDVQACVRGELARDVSVHFAQRWNHHKEEMGCGPSYPFLLPDLFIDTHHLESAHLSLPQTYDKPVTSPVPISSEDRLFLTPSPSSANIAELEESILGLNPTTPVSVTTYQPVAIARKISAWKGVSEVDAVHKRLGKRLAGGEGGFLCDGQLLRSISQWSGGEYTEKSILAAIVAVIREAKHFVYVENQYFISTLQADELENMPKNEVAAAVYERLKRAISARETFRVMVVLPLYPEGNFREDPIIRFIMWLQYKTISHTATSIARRLADEFPGVNLDDYMSFMSLRGWGRLGDRAVTEQVYVHSKLVIADDVVTVIGSMNINDRSLIGERDSEIAVLIRDREYVPSKMNGQDYQAGRFTHGLRTQLWCEHLGLSDPFRVQDPVHDEVYHGLLRATALANTAIYEDLFPEISSNRVTSIEDFEALLLSKSAKGGGSLLSSMLCDREATLEVLEGLKRVKGHLVMYPSEFLVENMGISFIDMGLNNVVQARVFQ